MLEWTGKGLYKIGVIGGIASGKSTIIKYLSSYRDIEIINLDKIGHQVLNYQTIALELENEFGTDIFLGSNQTASQTDQEKFKSGVRTIDRLAMGRIVFSDKQKLSKLNQIVWPQIAKHQNKILAGLEQAGNVSIAAVEGAVILEANFLQYFHEIWCSNISKEIAMQRVLVRNPELTSIDAERRIKSQMSDEDRLKFMEERNLSHKYFTIDTSRDILINRGIMDERLKIYFNSDILRSLDKKIL